MNVSESLRMIHTHEQVKDISVTENFQAEEIKNGRKQLLNKMKKVQEMRSMASIRSGFFLKLNSSNAQMVSKLPFMDNSQLHVSERIVEVAGVSTIRTQVGRLLKEVLNEREELPQFFAKLDFKGEHLMPEIKSYLPPVITMKEFFACCTVPALFGFYFTTELHESYLKFLIQIAENMPDNYFKKYSEHWLIDCIRYYILANGISEFVRASLCDVMLNLITNKDLLKLAKNRNTQEIANRVRHLIVVLINNMIENISLIPSGIRYLLNSIAMLASTPEKQISRLEFLILECILVPAISNIKRYNVLPPSYHFDENPNGPLNIVNTISKLFRSILHPGSAKTEDPFAASSETVEKFKKFLDLFSKSSTLKLTGPKLVQLLPALEMHCLFLFFSLQDIFLLTDICNDPNAPQSLQKAAQSIPTNVNVPFDFFRHEVWDFKPFGIVKPKIPDNTPKKLTDPIEISGDALFKFLSFAQIDSGAPTNLDKFLDHYERQMILQRNYQTESYIRHLSCVSKKVINNADSETVLLPALQIEIERHTKRTQQDKSTLREINTLLKIVDTEIEQISQLSNEALTFLCANLLDMFINSNTQFTIDLVLKKEDMLLQANDFFDFFQEKLADLKNFILPIAEYALDNVACQFHSYIMQNLSYEEYRQFKKTYQRMDSIFIDHCEAIINDHCISTVPVSMRSLLSNKEQFDSIRAVIRNALKNEIPLESVREIAKAFELIALVKEVETETTITKDELRSTFNYLLLSSNAPTLYSMGKYIQQYLVNITLGDVVFLTEKENDALKLFCYYLTNLDKVLYDYYFH